MGAALKVTVVPGACGAVLLAEIATVLARDVVGVVGAVGMLVTAVPAMTKSMAVEASASSTVLLVLFTHTVTRPDG